MEKVYLILRNNIESGPFTLQELLLQQLKPTDMIWVEGKSTAWTYLSEMELNFHIENETEPVSGQRNVRQIGDEIEQKAEEIRKRALSYKPKPLVLQSDPASDNSSYSRSFVTTQDSIEIINHKKEKNKTFNEVVMTTVIICLFAGGLYAGSNFLHTRKEIISPAATRVTPAKKTVSESPTNKVAEQDHPVVMNDVAKDSLIQQIAPNAEVKTRTHQSILPAKQTDSIRINKTAVQPINPDVNEPLIASTVKLPVTNQGDEPEQKQELVQKGDQVKKNEADNNKKSVVPKAEKAEEEEEKKKGLGQALKGIFKKKKKQDKDND